LPGTRHPAVLPLRELNQNALTAVTANSAVASGLAGRRRCRMPDRKTLRRAPRDKREGKSPSTQAGEFVREEMEHVREGKHGARSPQQAIAIGLSKARRAGIDLKPPSGEQASARARRQAQRDYERGHRMAAARSASRRRRAAVSRALESEPRASASPRALAAHGRVAAARRSATQRSAAAKRAARTKGHAGRSTAARKATRTRASLRRS